MWSEASQAKARDLSEKLKGMWDKYESTCQQGQGPDSKHQDHQMNE
jgi:hypothetical protein